MPLRRKRALRPFVPAHGAQSLAKVPDPAVRRNSTVPDVSELFHDEFLLRGRPLGRSCGTFWTRARRVVAVAVAVVCIFVVFVVRGG